MNKLLFMHTLLIPIFSCFLSLSAAPVAANDWPEAGDTIIKDESLNLGNIDKPDTKGHLGLTNVTLDAQNINLGSFTLEATNSKINVQDDFRIGDLGIGDTTINVGGLFSTEPHELLLMNNSSISADREITIGMTLDGLSPMPGAPELEHNNSVLRSKTAGIHFGGGLRTYSGNSHLIADIGPILDGGSGLRREDGATLTIKAGDMVSSQLIDATNLEAHSLWVHDLILRDGVLKITDVTSTVSGSITLENMNSEIGGINDPETGFGFQTQSVAVSGGTFKGDNLYFAGPTIFSNNVVANIEKMSISGELAIESNASVTVSEPDFASSLINLDNGRLFLKKDMTFPNLKIGNNSLLQNEGKITVTQNDFELLGSQIKSSADIIFGDFSAEGESHVEAGGNITSGTLKIRSGETSLSAAGDISIGSINAEKETVLAVSAPKGHAQTGQITASGLLIDAPQFAVQGNLDLESGNFSTAKNNVVTVAGNARLTDMKTALDIFTVNGNAHIDGGSFTANQMKAGALAAFENLVAKASRLEVDGSLSVNNAILHAEMRSDNLSIQKGVVDLEKAAVLNGLEIKDAYLYDEESLDIRQDDLLIDNSVLDSGSEIALQNVRSQGNAYVRGLNAVKVGDVNTLSGFTNVISENGSIRGASFSMGAGARLGLYAPKGEIFSEKINASIVYADKLSVNDGLDVANGYLRLSWTSSVGGDLNLNRVDSLVGDLSVKGAAVIHGGSLKAGNLAIAGQSEMDHLNAEFDSLSINDLLILESGVLQGSGSINLGSLRAYENNWLLADGSVNTGNNAAIFSGETSIYSASSNIEGLSFTQWNSGRLGLYAPKGWISADTIHTQTVSAAGLEAKNDLSISSGSLRLTGDKQSKVGRNLQLANASAAFKNMNVGANVIIEKGSTTFGSLTVGGQSRFDGGVVAGYAFSPAKDVKFSNSAQAGINKLSGTGNVYVSDGSWLAVNEIDLGGASLILSGNGTAKSLASAEKMENAGLFVGANSMFMSGAGGKDWQEAAHNALGVSASLGLWKPLAIGPAGGAVGSIASRKGGQVNFADDSLVIASAYSGLQPQGAIFSTSPLDANVSQGSRLHISQAEKNGLYRILGENLKVNYSGDAWKNPSTDSLLYKVERLEGDKLGWFRIVDNDVPITPEGRPPLEEGSSSGSIKPVIPSLPSTPGTATNPPLPDSPSSPSTPAETPSIPSTPNIPVAPITPPTPPDMPGGNPDPVAPEIPSPPAQLPVPDPSPAPDETPVFPDIPNNPSSPGDKPNDEPGGDTSGPTDVIPPDVPNNPSSPGDTPNVEPGGDTSAPIDGIPVLPPSSVPEAVDGTKRPTTPGQIFISNAINFWLMGNNPWLAGITIESAERLAVLGAVPQMALATREAMSEIILERASQRLSNNIESAELTDHTALWISPLYSSRLGFGLEAGIHDLDYKGNFGGMALGADWSRQTADFRSRLGIAAGIGGGYAKSSGDLAKTENSFDFWGLAAYGGIGIGNFGFYANLGFTSSYNRLRQDVPEAMRLPDLKSDITARAAGFEARAEYRFKTDWLDILPHAGVRYTSISVDNYDAYSNGCVLEGDSMNQSVWAFPMGLTFEKTYQTSSGWLLKPTLNVEAAPAAGDFNSQSTVRFTGISAAASLDTQIIDAITYGASAGLYVEKGNLGIGISYNAHFGEHTTKQSLSGVFKWEF